MFRGFFNILESLPSGTGFFSIIFLMGENTNFSRRGQFMPQSLFPDWDIKIPLCELSAFAVKSIFS
jgi:hypothetical protein